MTSPAADSGNVILETEGLTRHFGTIVAVDRLDLQVHAGEVHGFLGPNGSGKSTTVGMVLGLIKPTAGRIRLFGQPFRGSGDPLLRKVGAIIEAPAFYPYLSGRDNLRAIALAAGGVPDTRIEELLSQVGLADRAHSAFKTYSLGMKQRLGIASTLLTDPALVILDEPTNGLDPAGQREVRELIPRLAAEGRGVLLASHLLYEVQQVCNRVTIIRRGQVLESGPVAALLERGSYLEIGIDRPDEAVAVLQALPIVESVDVRNGRIAVVTQIEAAAEINRALAEKGLYPSSIVHHTSSLEDVFLDLTGDEGSQAREPGGDA
jgi:ABC-2 type transport system ATP-binding protein